LRWLRTGGSAAAQAADLWRLVPNQARHLLVRLTRAGKLILRGERRGAFYVRPAINIDRSKTDMDVSKSAAKTAKRAPR